MNDASEKFSGLKKYLLGTLGDEEAVRRIEENILLNDRFAEQVSLIEDELIEAYLDGELTPPESENFRRFFLAGTGRKEKFRFIENLKQYAAGAGAAETEEGAESKISVLDWLRLPVLLRFAVVLIFVAGIGFVIWRAAVAESDTERGLAQLSAAYRGTRPLEARSTADFGYAPFSVTRGNSVAVTPADSKALDRAKILLLDASDDPADASAHHALGLFYLNEKQFDKALGEFDKALEIAPAGSAAINSDAGATLLEKAGQTEMEDKGGETLELLNSSLKYLNRALEINERQPEALFNKALVLQKMRAAEQARQAWKKYLEIDTSSEWANEARRNLENLRPPENQTREKGQVIEDFMDAFRGRDEERAWRIASQTKEMITGVMVSGQIADRFLEADRQELKPEAEEFLSAFFYLGQLEKNRAGDEYFSRLARLYADAGAERKILLANARQSMARSFEAMQRSDFAAATQDLEQAKSAFLSAGNEPEAMTADYQTAYCLTRQNKILESNKLVNGLIETAEKKNYKWLGTLAYGWAASNFTLLDEHSKALDYNEKYLAAARETSNSYEIQKSLTQITQAYWMIGDGKKVLDNIYKNSRVNVDYYLSPRQHNRNLLFTTEGLFRLKLFEAAAVFASEELATALISNEPSFLHTSRYHLALIYGKKGDYENSLNEINEAFRIAESNKNPELRKILEAKTSLISAHLRRESGDCPRAVADYDRTIGEYENSEFSINMYEARKGRLLCYIDLKNSDAVRNEMPDLLKKFDEYRRKISKEYDRNVFFDNEQTVYDIAADYAFTELKDSETAFDYAENSRARSLLDLVSKTETKPLSLGEIRRRIPPRVQVLYYSVLADKILVWQISRDKYVVAESPVKSAELNELVKEYISALQRKSSFDQNAAEFSRKLYRLLIKPVESTLDKDRPLCILADKILFRVPFASLVSPDTDRFLLEDFALLYAPSASVFIKETELAAQKPAVAGETILSVGNPAFSRSAYKELADLPSAENEAARVADFYRPNKTLLKEKASKEEIVRHLSETEVFHFAGHYLADPNQPTLSKFLLAGGELPVGEIMSKNLPRMRLMILSACETGVEGFYKGEGMIGAARAFLAADVPLVVASQWPVDSDATAELMIGFHKYRSVEKLNTVEALRRTQLDMLKGQNTNFRNPFYWSAFLPIGGYADY